MQEAFVEMRMLVTGLKTVHRERMRDVAFATHELEHIADVIGAKLDVMTLLMQRAHTDEQKRQAGRHVLKIAKECERLTQERHSSARLDPHPCIRLGNEIVNRMTELQKLI
jgi:hypothetical protein